MLNMSIRKSPRLAALAEKPARRSPRLAKAEARLEVPRRSPRLEAKARENALRDEALREPLRRSPRIAEAKAAAQAEQAERAENTLRRSVRINKPSQPDTLVRWQALLQEIQYENAMSDLSDSDYESDSDSDDYEVYKH